jgi:hypothetical protein
MKKSVIHLLLQCLILGSFFIKGFQFKINNLLQEASPIQAIFSDSFPIIGRIVLVYIFLSVLFHLVTLVMQLINRELSKKTDDILTAVITIQMIAGLLVVTFVGTYLLMGGFLMIGLIVLSIFLKYKYLKT